MAKKKIAYQLTVDVLEFTIKQLLKCAEQRLLDDYELKISLKDNEAVLASIRKGLQSQAESAVSLYNAYDDDIIDEINLEKILKQEITAAEKKLQEKRLAEEKAEEEKRRARSGLLRLHPDELDKAMKLLKDAGIKTFP